MTQITLNDENHPYNKAGSGAPSLLGADGSMPGPSKNIFYNVDEFGSR